MSEIETLQKEVDRQKRLIASNFEDIKRLCHEGERKTELLRQVWNHLSLSLVGLDITDPRWQPAAQWLADNRMYQNVVPRLPHTDARK